jgi:hypothetical protein
VIPDRLTESAHALTTRQVFRMPLEQVMLLQRAKHPDVPIPIFAKRAIEYLKKKGISPRSSLVVPVDSAHIRRGMEEEGLFRKSGSMDQITWAIENLDRGTTITPFRFLELVRSRCRLMASDCDFDFLTKVRDPHTVAGLLKKFIREIPGSLLTQESGEKFLAAVGTGLEFVFFFFFFSFCRERHASLSEKSCLIGTHRHRAESENAMETVRALLKTLPLWNRELLREIIGLGHTVINNACTKMNSNNLAIVLGPNLWVTSGQNTILQDSKAVVELTELLVAKYPVFFPVRGFFFFFF